MVHTTTTTTTTTATATATATAAAAAAAAAATTTTTTTPVLGVESSSYMVHTGETTDSGNTLTVLSNCV